MKWWASILGEYTARASYRIAGDTAEHNWSDQSGLSKSIILNETPPTFRPIVQVIDNYERNYKLGMLFETRVGKGKLLVCSMDLDTDSRDRPAARQLRASIINYASGKKFKPAFEMPMDWLIKILRY